MSSDDAQILDRGYRRFDGTRSGVRGAVRSVAWHTTRSILGLGRPGRHKVFPIIVTVIAFVPAMAFLALAVLIGDLMEGELRPEYWEFFGFSVVAALLFAALVVPEALVRDRRNGMLSLYMSSPLEPPTYLAAKVLAALGTMSIIVLGPPLLWLFGYTFQSQGPDGFDGWLSVLLRLIAAGLVIGAVLVAVGMGAASINDRRAFASVTVILILFGATIAVDLLVELAEVGHNIRLLDPVGVAGEAAPRIFGTRSDEYRDVGSPLVAMACTAWTLLGVSAVAWRYRRAAVT